MGLDSARVDWGKVLATARKINSTLAKLSNSIISTDFTARSPFIFETFSYPRRPRRPRRYPWEFIEVGDEKSVDF